jgi:hypothetical protein
MNRAVVALLLVGTVLPDKAYAYLDPASGNALVSFFIALFGSAMFFGKTIFYKFFSSSNLKSNSETGNINTQCMPILFSEGQVYWTTFRPIVEEFIDKNIHFRYVSLDVHDPGLTIDSTYMHSTRFSKDRLGFAKLAKLKGPIMLSTTPNIGSEGYPMGRPAGVKSLVHIFHAMVDLSCYRKGSLDYYDSVLMTGEHEAASIRHVEAARNTKEKSLVVVGLPCLDDLFRQKEEMELERQPDVLASKTVLIAPSWGAKGCFSEYGTEFVKTLSEANYRVIIRVHPHSHVFEPESVERWKFQTSGLENVFWDEHVFGTQAMSQADILISDASSIRFDFAFLYLRPVISLEISRQSRSIFESDYMSETWADTMSEQLGAVVNSDNLDAIDQMVRETIENFTPSVLGALRNRYVANFGHSSSVIAEHLNKQAALLSMNPE